MMLLQLEKRCQITNDTLDHAESQSLEKTNISQNVRWSDHTPCLLDLMYFSRRGKLTA